MKFIAVLLVIGILVAGYFFLVRPNAKAPEASLKTDVDLSQTANKMKTNLGNAWENLSLKTEDLRAELARDGKIVRTKVKNAGSALADAAADAKITASVKTKYVAEPGLSALSIAVNTTDGVVTLSGKVSSIEDVQRAMKIALDTDGVREVVSSLQVAKEPAKP